MYIKSAIREQFPNVQRSIHLIVPWSQYQMHSQYKMSWLTAADGQLWKQSMKQNLKMVRVTYYKGKYTRLIFACEQRNFSKPPSRQMVCY